MPAPGVRPFRWRLKERGPRDVSISGLLFQSPLVPESVNFIFLHACPHKIKGDSSVPQGNRRYLRERNCRRIRTCAKWPAAKPRPLQASTAPDWNGLNGERPGGRRRNHQGRQTESTAGGSSSALRGDRSWGRPEILNRLRSDPGNRFPARQRRPLFPVRNTLHQDAPAIIRPYSSACSSMARAMLLRS